MSEIIAGKSKKELTNIIHHTAAETGKTYSTVRNVLTGRITSALITEALIRNLGKPSEAMTRRVQQHKNPSLHTPKRKTPCICQMCEANGREPHYTRFVFWTGTLPARIRCPRCAQSLGLRDYEEVHDYV